MVHSKECIEQNKRIVEEWKELELKYPHICHKCRGYGYISHIYDPSPSGVSLSSGFMIDDELCPECSEIGKCPACGSETLNDAKDKCSSCGWDSNTWQAPPETECICDLYPNSGLITMYKNDTATFSRTITRCSLI